MKFDINSLNKYFTPQALGDFNAFIESMPMRAGYAACVVAGVVWFVAGLSVVYATTVAKDVAEIRAELVKSEALKPVVPQLLQTGVNDEEVRIFAERLNKLYKDVTIASSGNKITFKAVEGKYFGAFREAINHTYNGGQGWRLSLQSMCVGRECKSGFLSGEFVVNRLTVQR